MSHSCELEIIRWIQEVRNPVFDEFFKFLNFFDRQEFLFALIPALWLGVNWKWGLRLFYILLLSSLVNHALKDLFALPRPFQLDPSIGIIQVGGYGFPSGAAQTVILLSGLLLNSCRAPWAWTVAGLYVALISFSRVYLGVHFPTDVLGGWVVGFALWAFVTYTRPRLEAKLEKLQVRTLFALSLLIPAAILLCEPNSPGPIRMCIAAIGLGVGLWITRACHWTLRPAKTTKQCIWRAAVGIIGTFLLYFLLSSIPVAPFFVLGLWIATGSVFLVRKCEKYCL